MSRVKCKNISKWFNKKNIFEGLSYSIAPGEIHLVYGRSGSGKTTLLNCIAGVEQINNGSIVINNQFVSQFTADKRASFRLKNIGILYQFFNLLPALTVKENILLPAYLSKKEDKSYFERLCDQFSIHDILNRWP